MQGMEGVEGHGSPVSGAKGVITPYTAIMKEGSPWYDPGLHTVQCRGGWGVAGRGSDVRAPATELLSAREAASSGL